MSSSIFAEIEDSYINEITFESLSPKAQQALVSLYKQNPISIWDVEEKTTNDKTKTTTLAIEMFEAPSINKDDIELMQKNGYIFDYVTAIKEEHDELKEDYPNSDIFSHLVAVFREEGSK